MNPFRDEMKTTGSAKGRAMGVSNEFLPDRASRLAGTPNAKTVGPPPDQHGNQFPEDKHAPGYDNNASGWVTGAGESGEGKPGFDSSKRSG